MRSLEDLPPGSVVIERYVYTNPNGKSGVQWLSQVVTRDRSLRLYKVCKTRHLHDRLDAALRRCGVPSTPQPVGYTIWINGVQYDDLNVDPWDVPTLRRLGAIGDAHDLFVENAEWSHFVQDGVRHKRLVHSLGADVKLEIDDKPVDLGVHRRFYSTPRYISGG